MYILNEWFLLITATWILMTTWITMNFSQILHMFMQIIKSISNKYEKGAWQAKKNVPWKNSGSRMDRKIEIIIDDIVQPWETNSENYLSEAAEKVDRDHRQSSLLILSELNKILPKSTENRRCSDDFRRNKRQLL